MENDKRKIYPLKLQKLLSEVATSGVIKYPASMQVIIKKYKKLHQEVHGGHILTREEVAILMMSIGVEGMKKEIKKLRAVLSVRN